MTLDDQIAAACNAIATERVQQLEAMIRVFIAETGESVRDLELVEQRHSDATCSYWLRRRR